MTATGDLNRRVTLLAPAESNDGAGGVTRNTSAVTTLWAQVVPLSDRSDVSAGSFGAALRAHIVIRFRDDITTRHQLQDGVDVYRVVASRPSADRRFLEIEAERRED